MSGLDVSHLKVWEGRSGHTIIPDLSFRIHQGSCLAIVGESGSGKSLTCRAIMRLSKAGIRQSGDIRLGDANLAELPEKEMRKRRGKQLCLIVQNGMRAFDPSRVIGAYLQETLAWHFSWSRDETVSRMKKAMETVMLKDPVALMNKYPHQLSGGMLQRVMIALTIVLEPEVVIADEPTTALDTISQFEVVEQLLQLRTRIGCSMLFVTHDLGVVKRIADEVLVMKNGAAVENGTTRDIFTAARHPYTRRLVSAKQAIHQHFAGIMGGVSHVDG